MRLGRALNYKEFSSRWDRTIVESTEERQGCKRDLKPQEALVIWKSNPWKGAKDRNLPK